jgi:hypothetical protein
LAFLFQYYNLLVELSQPPPDNKLQVKIVGNGQVQVCLSNVVVTESHMVPQVAGFCGCDSVFDTGRGVQVIRPDFDPPFEFEVAEDQISIVQGCFQVPDEKGPHTVVGDGREDYLQEIFQVLLEEPQIGLANQFIAE